MNEIITLDHIKNRSIDDILELYRCGYRLEEYNYNPVNPSLINPSLINPSLINPSLINPSPINPSPINPSTLQACPEGCVLQSEADTSYKSGLYFGITAGLIWGIMIGTVISYLMVKRNVPIPTT